MDRLTSKFVKGFMMKIFIDEYFLRCSRSSKIMQNVIFLVKKRPVFQTIEMSNLFNLEEVDFSHSGQLAFPEVHKFGIISIV